jgi:hypothetical protein
LISLLALGFAPGAGQLPPEILDASPTTPPPGSRLEVFLMTIGPGDAIWERFSHNALIIRDEDAGTEVAYNWGIFDFSQEDFIGRLARGRMLYRMEGYPAPALISLYGRLDRDVWLEKVNLSPRQRLELKTLIEETDTDANREYRYDYYRDNCSARIRDVLDEVLDGQIRAATEDVDTGTSYRWHTARLLRPVLWAYAGIQFVVGNRGDESISAWEEMFLPLRMRDHLLGVRVRTSDGEDVPLLGPSVQVVVSSRPPPPDEVPNFLFSFLGAGVLLGVLFVIAGEVAARGHRWGQWLLAATGTAWSGTVGVLGTGLVLSWFLTDHFFWGLNENAFQANPLSLATAVVLLPAALGRGRRVAVYLTRAVVALSIGGLVLQLLPGFDQVNGEMLAFMVPAHLGLAWGVSRAWTSLRG